MQATKNTITKATAIEDLLRSEFAARKNCNPKYSLRAFAKHIEMEPSSLSKVIHGKRSLSAKRAAEILNKMVLKPARSEHKAVETKVDEDFLLLNADYVGVFSQWQYFAIMELTRLADFESNCAYVCRKLKINQELCEYSVAKLFQLGFLTKNKNGRWQETFKNLSNVQSQVFSQAHRNYQRQLIEKSALALDEVSPALRDQTSMTMAISADKIDEAKAAIKEFRRKFCKDLQSSSKSPDAVYQLTIGFFPLSQSQEE